MSPRLPVLAVVTAVAAISGDGLLVPSPAAAAEPALAQADPAGPTAPAADGEPAIEDVTPAAVELPPRPVKDDKAILTLQLENDIFTGRDQHYTNGVRLAYLSAENDVPDWLENAARQVPLFANEGNLRVSYALGQNMYTPRDIEIAAPQPDDHPWAGYTYASIGLINDAGRRLDNLELTLGIVGPSSLAAQTQEFVHKVINTRTPRGWDNQLHDEPIVNIAYERSWRAMWRSEYLGLEADVTPHAGGAFGNAFIHANSGVMLRLGDDLPADFGPPRIRPSLPGSDFFVPSERFGWYIFAGLDGRVVLRNIFLDGNTFHDSASVDKKWVVGEAQAGIAFTFNDIRIAYTHVYRTEEFEGQDEGDTFGALSVSFRF